MTTQEVTDGAYVLNAKTGKGLQWCGYVFEAFDGDLAAAEDFLVNGKYDYFSENRYHALHFAVTNHLQEKVKKLELALTKHTTGHDA